ncbi:GNAT family N-acetyltransferase [Solibacillus sp. FSL H8-0523]|uniref:GNAT family N-acetyltransferase n=1 Tax=Solibacillus sp. FSL H8-0523 TaxID=2954511 RepID=UPI0031014DF2
MNFALKRATVLDVEKLQQIGRETFYETFHEQNDEQTMQQYLQRAFAPEKLLAEIKNPLSIIKLLYVDHELAGYVKVNEGNAQTEGKAEDAIEIERIYILNAFQKMGLGKILMSEAILIAQQLHKSSIWLGVWEKNVNAIAFYESQGFVKTTTHTFMMGNEAQLDYIMVKMLD